MPWGMRHPATLLLCSDGVLAIPLPITSPSVSRYDWLILLIFNINPLYFHYFLTENGYLF